MRILVVDDDRIVLSSCLRVLSDEGHDVILSSSTSEAIGLLETNAFDLLIADVIMPESDGFQLVAEVHSKWPNVPVLLMSGYPTAKNISLGKECGASHFIAKPFTPDELVVVLEEMSEARNRESEEQDEQIGTGH